MDPPDIAEDWEGKTKEDRDAERRQLLMFAATVTEPTKQGTKHQLLCAFRTWEKIQDSILDQVEGLSP